MSAVEGNDDKESTAMSDADGDRLAADSTGAVSMPANCVVCAILLQSHFTLVHSSYSDKTSYFTHVLVTYFSVKAFHHS